MMKTTTIAVILALVVACGAPRERVSAQVPSGAPSTPVDQLLAPIALYPDSLLAQILLSAAEPAKVAELDKWLKAMSTTKGTELQDATVKAGFDASFVALALFPQVVAQMAADLDWTTRLGQAFAMDRSAVFASIQKLRHQAQTVGTLKTTPQQTVTNQTTPAGEQVIVIEPANPQIIYVPQYNTTTVYVQAPPTTTTVVVQDNSANEALAAGMIGFTAGIVVGAAVSNPYYYGPYGYHGGAYMYGGAWDDYYDHREDAREDWMDHREDMNENRTDRRENAQDNRGERAENARDAGVTREGVSQKRTETQQNRSATTQSAASGRTGSAEARGYGDGSRAQTAQPQSRSGTSSDAFSGYSSGKSERSASSRGQQSRSSSRSRGGGGGRRR
jgi:Protein of unknown function (DUF3300)